VFVLVLMAKGANGGQLDESSKKTFRESHYGACMKKQIAAYPSTMDRDVIHAYCECTSRLLVDKIQYADLRAASEGNSGPIMQRIQENIPLVRTQCISIIERAVNQ